MAPQYVACRICHNVEGKLKNYEDGDFLIKAYEEITGYTFLDLQYLSKFCPQCAYLIRKTYKFKKKCVESYKFIMEHLDTGKKITKRFIEMSASHRKPPKPSTWEIKDAHIIDYTHNLRAVKNKKKNLIEGIFNIQHLTVPKDLSAETLSEPKPVYSSESELDLDEPIIDSEVETVETPIISPETEQLVNFEPLKMDTPMHVLETPVQILERPVLCESDKQKINEILDEVEVKMEDETEDVLHIADQKLEVKLKIDPDPDPDNLTLQEIKAELLGATESAGESGKGEKRKKTAENKEKESKMSQKVNLLQVQARRHKSNQDLEEHFAITQFLTEEDQVQEFLKRREGEGYLEGKFKCELCLKSFKEQKWMDAHVKKHEPAAGSYVCNVCKIRCRTPKLHRTHRDCNHTTRYACRVCSFVTYNKAQALKHHGWHEGVEHTCQHCGATFRKHTTYMGHLRRTHPSAHICGACARSFVSAYGLNLHVKAVHKDINKLENDSTRCEECDVTFVSRRVYVRHVLTTDRHKDISQDILGCRKCGEHFETKEEMEKHTHYKERKYVRKDVPKRSIKCDECGEVFSHPNGVYQHYLREHPDTPYRFAVRRHYLCEQCGKTFKSPGLLQQHALTHLGLRPPPARRPAGRNCCRLCGKTYSKLSGLFRHKLTHLGVRRHKCHICEKAFTDTSNLKQHVQGVHLNIRRVRKR